MLVTSGGKAPGPQPLKECIVKITGVLDSKEGWRYALHYRSTRYSLPYCRRRLSWWDRRALFDQFVLGDDDQMISCKSGNWWETNPQRGRANNSAVLMRHKITKEFFMDIWKRVELSNAGEPGIYFNNDKDWGTNPCCEIALRPYQFCNLCEVNASDIESQEDLNTE